MKTISVYDAVKLATKGPLSIKTEASAVQGYDEVSIVFPGGSIDREQVDPFVVSTVNVHYFGPHDVEPKATSALLTHFFNHGPSLLAMLEEFVKLYEPYRKQLDENETQILDEAIALIAKASKVEVVE